LCCHFPRPEHNVTERRDVTSSESRTSIAPAMIDQMRGTMMTLFRNTFAAAALAFGSVGAHASIIYSNWTAFPDAPQAPRTPSSVPEPATALLIGLGLLVVPSARRKARAEAK
jgi:hypothetical protein